MASSSPLPTRPPVEVNRLEIKLGHRDLEKELSEKLYEQSGSLLENTIEMAITLVSFTAIVLVLLIFVFVARESLPVIFGKTDNSRSGLTINPDDVTRKSPSEIAQFLQVDTARVENLSPEVLRQLVQSRNEELASDNNPDSKLNTTTWSMLVRPYQWTGYNVPSFIWQPVGAVEKYNIVPLFLGSLKITAVALLFAIPISLMAAIYVSQLATPRTREFVKPIIELLAGIPSVVLGFLGFILISPYLIEVLHLVDPSATPFNAFFAGMALALAVIPLIFTIAEDAITAVPSPHKDAARALGATEWHATMGVVVPAAFPGIFAAVVLGFGRAIGETMVVLIASGNAATMDWSVFQSTKTVTATIAGELNEVAQGSDHYRILFLIGTILFLITFVGNLVADFILQRLKARLEGTLTVEDPLRDLYQEKSRETHVGNAVV